MSYFFLNNDQSKIIAEFRHPTTGAITLPDNDPRVIYFRAPHPTEVTMLQFRRAVRAAGKADQVITAIQGLSAGMQEAWRYAHRVPRDADFMLALQTALGVTDAQVDAFFQTASTYPAN